jgi:hypothetical protein
VGLAGAALGCDGPGLPLAAESIGGRELTATTIPASRMNVATNATTSRPASRA